MERKKLMVLILAGILAAIVLSVAIVGVTTGAWPWNGFQAAPDETPVATEPAEPDPTDETESTPAGNETESTTKPTTGNPLFDGEDPDGNTHVKDEVILDNNTGNGNSGNGNTGNGNSGNGNTGNGNTGNGNSGNDNSGNDNSGNDNSGNENSGSNPDTVPEIEDADKVFTGSQIPGW